MLTLALLLLLLFELPEVDAEGEPVLEAEPVQPLAESDTDMDSLPYKKVGVPGNLLGMAMCVPFSTIPTGVPWPKA